jgi:hypothetical protein
MVSSRENFSARNSARVLSDCSRFSSLVLHRERFSARNSARSLKAAAFQDSDLASAFAFVRCIDEVGERQDSARGHFRHAGITVEEL